MNKYFRLIRIKHYIKNLLIFAPLIFSGGILEAEKLIYAICGFLAFSFLASSIYIYNDLCDVENDKNHPIKKARPIASGEVSSREAKAILVFLTVLAAILNVTISTSNNLMSWILMLTYFILNILYSKYFKNIALIDVLVLVVFYMIRLYYGAVIVNTDVSGWLYLTIMSFSFYLGLGKRRNEFIKQGSDTRKVLQHYNKEFLDKNMYICMGCTIVFYALWAQHIAEILASNLILFTIPLVLVISMRYSLILEGDSQGDPIEVISKDVFLLVLGGIYSVFMFFLLYILK